MRTNYAQVVAFMPVSAAFVCGIYSNMKTLQVRSTYFWCMPSSLIPRSLFSIPMLKRSLFFEHQRPYLSRSRITCFWAGSCRRSPPGPRSWASSSGQFVTSAPTKGTTCTATFGFALGSSFFASTRSLHSSRFPVSIVVTLF